MHAGAAAACIAHSTSPARYSAVLQTAFGSSLSSSAGSVPYLEEDRKVRHCLREERQREHDRKEVPF